MCSSAPKRQSRFSIKTPGVAAVPQQTTELSNIQQYASISATVQQQLQQLTGLQNSSLLGLLGGALPTPQGPKESRELFVGNVLASGVTDSILKDFLNGAMRQVGLVKGPDDPIVSCRMNAKFSFIELRTAEDCNNALNLNGIPFLGQCLKISRPSKYAGPATPAKTWQELTGQAAHEASVAAVATSDPNTKIYRYDSALVSSSFDVGDHNFTCLIRILASSLQNATSDCSAVISLDSLPYRRSYFS
jgi:hypothetical protein